MPPTNDIFLCPYGNWPMPVIYDIFLYHMDQPMPATNDIYPMPYWLAHASY